MVCIYCGSETEVTNSRSRARLPSTWRRRQCKACVAQFSTSEFPDYSTALAVREITGKLEPFQRDRLFLSLYESLKHRPDASSAAGALTDTVIGKLLHRPGRSAEIPAGAIATTAHATLKRFDPFAATSYKAFHQAALKPATAVHTK